MACKFTRESTVNSVVVIYQSATIQWMRMPLVLKRKTTDIHSHLLLIEQQVRYFEKRQGWILYHSNGAHITPEGEKLLSYLQKETYVQAMLAFPRNTLQRCAIYVSLLIVQNVEKALNK